mmetsp:Transcript_129509/g.182611  ORF Transcript_129509/g.182611 Transcript_129509/m.182611 type:complete len:310 (-) Transcript_129509:292-1221(-)
MCFEGASQSFVLFVHQEVDQAQKVDASRGAGILRARLACQHWHQAPNMIRNCWTSISEQGLQDVTVWACVLPQHGLSSLQKVGETSPQMLLVKLPARPTQELRQVLNVCIHDLRIALLTALHPQEQVENPWPVFYARLPACFQQGFRGTKYRCQQLAVNALLQEAQGQLDFLGLQATAEIVSASARMYQPREHHENLPSRLGSHRSKVLDPCQYVLHRSRCLATLLVLWPQLVKGCALALSAFVFEAQVPANYFQYQLRIKEHTNHARTQQRGLGHFLIIVGLGLVQVHQHTIQKRRNLLIGDDQQHLQ